MTFYSRVSLGQGERDQVDGAFIERTDRKAPRMEPTGPESTAPECIGPHTAVAGRLDRKDALREADSRRDIAVCGRSLDGLGASRFASEGAHDPTPTPYWVLERLFPRLGLDESSHLLDVGCGAGRALAFFVEAGLLGRATGVELDPRLATIACAWSEGFANVSVRAGSALDIPLAPYSHFYLFNPFDTRILEAFVDKVESEARGPIVLAHMSDNGESYTFLGRAGWTLAEQGEFQDAPLPEGGKARFYDHPQHFSIWTFVPPEERRA